MHAAMPAAFEDVPEADEIRIDVGLGVLELIAHAGLGGEMHDRIEFLASE